MIEKTGLSLQQPLSCHTSQVHMGLLRPLLTPSQSCDSSFMLKFLLCIGSWSGYVLSRISLVKHRALQRRWITNQGSTAQSQNGWVGSSGDTGAQSSKPW